MSFLLRSFETNIRKFVIDCVLSRVTANAAYIRWICAADELIFTIAQMIASGRLDLEFAKTHV